MAPPRRTAAAVDDPKADAAVTTSTTKSGTASRSRKNASSAAKAAAAENNAAASGGASGAHQQQQQQQQQQKQQQHHQVDWSTMPLSVLHDYRHAYNLQCPSSYNSQIAQIYLSQGIGLQSPTAIAARRAQQAELRRKSELGNHHNTRRLSSTNGHDPQGLKREKEFSNGSGIRPRNSQPSNIPAYRIHRTLSPGASQSHLAQGRVSKDHLASNVRRHFNSSGLVEQDAIARFLYKVREERRGKEFRIKFSP